MKNRSNGWLAMCLVACGGSIAFMGITLFTGRSGLPYLELCFIGWAAALRWQETRS